MKPILNQQIIDKYILDEFGNIPNPPTKDEIIRSINDYILTLEKVKLWVLFGGDLMIKNNNKNTILYIALYMGKLDIVEYILNKGVDVDIDSLNNINQTPLLYASQYGNINVINLLLERGANINYQDKRGYSALHYACGWDKLNVVKVLVENGIDIYLKNNNNKNETALDVAKRLKYQQIVDYLTPLYNIK